MCPVCYWMTKELNIAFKSHAHAGLEGVLMGASCMLFAWCWSLLCEHTCNEFRAMYFVHKLVQLKWGDSATYVHFQGGRPVGERKIIGSAPTREHAPRPARNCAWYSCKEARKYRVFLGPGSPTQGKLASSVFSALGDWDEMWDLRLCKCAPRSCLCQFRQCTHTLYTADRSLTLLVAAWARMFWCMPYESAHTFMCFAKLYHTLNLHTLNFRNLTVRQLENWQFLFFVFAAHSSWMSSN